MIGKMTWEQAAPGLTVDDWLAQLFERMPAEGLIVGEALPEKVLVHGQETSVYPFTADVPGAPYSGLAALWRNDAQERLFLFIYLEGGASPPADFMPKLRSYLDTFN